MTPRNREVAIPRGATLEEKLRIAREATSVLPGTLAPRGVSHGLPFPVLGGGGPKGEPVSVKTVSTLALGAAIVASTYWAIERIAEHKADALAGGGTFILDGGHGAEGASFTALLGQLGDWGEGDLAASLAALRTSGHIWIAPRLGGGRSAAYVSALGRVSRIYLGRDELVARSLPFPDLDIPAPAQRTFATIRLAGTLIHELQHFEGVDDEGAAYDRETTWYRQLGERIAGGLEGEERRYFDWAVASALESVAAARERAAAPGS